MFQEIWKPVKGYEELYSVSNTGKIVSYTRSTPLVLISHPDKDGYRRVGLYKNGKCWQTSVHKVVAINFLPNPKSLKIINHKDEVKDNNRSDNLEWCTSQYNQEYSMAKHYKFISPTGELHEIFNLNIFCRKYDIGKGCMSLVAQGKRKQHKGWTKG